MATYNAAALAARPAHRGRRRRPGRLSACRRRSTRPTPTLQREVWRAQQRARATSASARRARRPDRRRRAGLPGVVPRLPARRRRAGPAVDDAHRPATLAAIVGRRRRRRRRGLAAYAGHVDGARRWPTRRCATPSCIGDADDGDRASADARRGRRSPTTPRPPVAATDGGLAGVLAVQLGHHRPAQGRDPPPRQSAGDRTRRTPARCSRSTPDDRFLSVAKLFFAYGLGNSLTFPLAVRRYGGPRPPAADAGRGRPRSWPRSSRRCSSPAPASSPACSTPTSRPTTFASVRATVTAGEALPGRPAAALRRAVRSSRCSTASARPRRCTSSSRTARPAAGRAPAAAGAGLRGAAARRRRRVVTEPDTPGYLHVRGPSMATGYWSRDAATRRRVRRRVAAHRRRLHPLGRRLLDVPRPQQRHDQGRWHLGVAGRGRGRAGRAPRRPRSRRRRGSQRQRAGGDRRVRRRRVRVRRSTRRRSTRTAASGWRRSSARGGSSSSTSCRRRRPARSSASPCATRSGDARHHRPARRRAGGGAAARGARLHRDVARRPGRRAHGDRPARGDVLPGGLRPQPAGRAPPPGDLHARRGRRRAAGAARPSWASSAPVLVGHSDGASIALLYRRPGDGAGGHRAPRLRRGHQRRLDRRGTDRVRDHRPARQAWPATTTTST